jgi:hypothetical protein
VNIVSRFYVGKTGLVSIHALQIQKEDRNKKGANKNN